MLQYQLEQLQQQLANVMMGEPNAPTEWEYAVGDQDLLSRVIFQTKVFDQIFSAVPDPSGVMARLQPQLEMALMHGKFSRGEFSCHIASQTRYYEYSLNPFFSNENMIDGIVGIARDTTYYKQIEPELRDAQEPYRKLFELANDWIFIIDASTDQILGANSQASKRLGYTCKEICLLSFVDISSPAAAAYYQTTIVPDLEKTGSRIFDHALRHRNGQEIHVEISSRLIEYQDQLVFEFSARELARK